LKSLWFDEAFHREADIGAAHDGTCQWLFSHPVYETCIRREHVTDHNGILWIAGKPGSGKSILIKKTLNRIKEVYGSSASVIAFFFNARGTFAEKSAHGFYQSLLGQLLKQHRQWPRDFLEKYQERKGAGEGIKWHSAELRTSLRTALLSQGRHPIYLFVDALDECQRGNNSTGAAPFKEVVDFLEELGLSASHGSLLNICVSRRHFPNLPRKPLEIAMDGMNNRDIERYIQENLVCRSVISFL